MRQEAVMDEVLITAEMLADAMAAVVVDQPFFINHQVALGHYLR